MNYSKEETKLLEKINEKIEELDINLSKMDSTDSKIKHFTDQEKALHDLHSIIRKGKKIDRIENRAEKDATKKTENWIDDEASAVNRIDHKVNDLIGTLSNMNDDDSRVKSYVEQKKVVHDIKDIIKEFSK